MKKHEEKLRGEFIGLWLKIISSSNKNNVGIEGKVIDETKNTFTLQTKPTEEKERQISGRKKIIKNQCSFEITFKDNSKIQFSGKKIALRPEDRIKRLKKN